MPIALLGNVTGRSDPQQDVVARLFDIGPVAGMYVVSVLFALRLARPARTDEGYWSACALLHGLGPVVVAVAAILDSFKAGLPASANVFAFGCAMIICGPAMTFAGLVRSLLHKRTVASAGVTRLRRRGVHGPARAEPPRSSLFPELHESAHIRTGGGPSTTTRLTR